MATIPPFTLMISFPDPCSVSVSPHQKHSHDNGDLLYDNRTYPRQAQVGGAALYSLTLWHNDSKHVVKIFFLTKRLLALSLSTNECV